MGSQTTQEEQIVFHPTNFEICCHYKCKSHSISYHIVTTKFDNGSIVTVAGFCGLHRPENFPDLSREEAIVYQVMHG
jgi:hypothetical protein